MSSALADKIKETQNSFAKRLPGAVEACPFAKQAPSEAPPSPVSVSNAFALTQDIRQQALAPGKAPEQKTKKDWIEILLVDMEGKPVPNERYRITPPGGEPVEGRLNEHGQAGLYQIDSGNCKITFPDLDKEAWD